MSKVSKGAEKAADGEAVVVESVPVEAAVKRPRKAKASAAPKVRKGAKVKASAFRLKPAATSSFLKGPIWSDDQLYLHPQDKLALELASVELKASLKDVGMKIKDINNLKLAEQIGELQLKIRGFEIKERIAQLVAEQETLVKIAKEYEVKQCAFKEPFASVYGVDVEQMTYEPLTDRILVEGCPVLKNS